MSRLTKAQLVTEIASLRKQVGDLEIDVERWAQTACKEQSAAGDYLFKIERLEKQLADALFDLALSKGVANGSVRSIKLPAHMQAAKDMAMRGGIVVKVGGAS